MPTLINPFNFASSGKTLMEIITDAGLTSNLVLCLDAGDSSSYDGTSQTWTDVSGGSQNFFRGASGSAQASDPTFNGVAGNRSASEYFSLDGGDWFTEASGLTFAETWHKNNAAFTFGFVLYSNSPGGSLQKNIFNNEAFGGFISDPGVIVYLKSSTNELKFDVSGAGGASVLVTVLKTSFLPVSAGWVCVIFTMNEATGAMLVKSSVAAASALSGKTYTSPSSSGSVQAYSLMADPDGSNIWHSGTRLACVFAWNSVLTTGNLDTLYAAIKLRFPTLA